MIFPRVTHHQSNQKALVWTLHPAGQDSTSKPVEYILHQHQRAVSDLNWSPFHPDLLATCSYDTYIHLWDLRKTADKPSNSFCGWTGWLVWLLRMGVICSKRDLLTNCNKTAGATQVKWNKMSEWILASSHDTDVRIWDIRVRLVLCDHI